MLIPINTPSKPARVSLAALFVAVAGITMSSSAWAERWHGSVGAGVVYAPDYLGSDDYETSFWPVLSVNYGETLTINPRTGIEWHAIRNGDWTISPIIGYTFGRDNTGDISQFDKVRGGATLGMRVGLQQGPWLYSVSARAPVTGDVNGSEFDAVATLRMPINERTLFVVSPSIHYASESWTNSYFGVSEHDSARSGIASYSADGGYWRIGANTSLTYALTPEWSVTGFLGATYLSDNASDSPIVDELGSAWQTLSGVSLGYRF